MKLLEYRLGNGVRAFSTLRGDVRPDDAYSSFNVTHYCGDTPEHVAACRRELCSELSIDDSHLLLPHQVHSDRIVVIDPPAHTTRCRCPCHHLSRNLHWSLHRRLHSRAPLRRSPPHHCRRARRMARSRATHRQQNSPCHAAHRQ